MEASNGHAFWDEALTFWIPIKAWTFVLVFVRCFEAFATGWSLVTREVLRIV
jgi:hypothetical protein